MKKMIKSIRRMAFSFNSVAPHPNPNFTSSFLHNHTITPKKLKCTFISSNNSRSFFRSAATPSQESSDGQEPDLEDSPATSFSGSSSSSARTQIDLLDQLTSSSTSLDGGDNSQKLTIRQQLANLFGGRDDDFTIALGKKNLKKVSAAFLTISQKRNIKRQAYLNEVSQRNDSLFFASIGAFILLPPIVILGIAIATGYVQLFP